MINSCWKAKAHRSATQLDVAGKMASCLGEKTFQRGAYPAHFTFDLQRSQTGCDEAGEAGKNVGGSELNSTADDDEFHVAIGEIRESLSWRLAVVMNADEIGSRADTGRAFTGSQTKNLRSFRGYEAIKTLYG